MAACRSAWALRRFAIPGVIVSDGRGMQLRQIVRDLLREGPRLVDGLGALVALGLGAGPRLPCRASAISSRCSAARSRLPSARSASLLAS